MTQILGIAEIFYAPGIRRFRSVVTIKTDFIALNFSIVFGFSFVWFFLVLVMSGTIAAHSAIVLSILSLLCCFMFIPILVNKITSIQLYLENDSDEFRLLSNEIWDSIQDAKGGAVVRPRVARQALCLCDTFNKCPVGKQGSPGLDGSHGDPGVSMGLHFQISPNR